MSLATRFDEPELAPIAVDWELMFTQAPTKSGLLYWRSLLAGRIMPERSDLDPRAMARLLPHVNLVEVRQTAPGTWNYIVTLQGGHSREVLGAVQGRKLSEIFPPALAARWRGAFDLPRSSKIPVRLVTGANTKGKSDMVSEALVAPLGPPSHVTALFWVFVASRYGASAMPEKRLHAGVAAQ